MNENKGTAQELIDKKRLATTLVGVVLVAGATFFFAMKSVPDKLDQMNAEIQDLKKGFATKQELEQVRKDSIAYTDKRVDEIDSKMGSRLDRIIINQTSLKEDFKESKEASREMSKSLRTLEKDVTELRFSVKKR